MFTAKFFQGAYFAVEQIEDFTSFEEFKEAIKDVYLEATGGKTWILDIGNWRDPEYVEKPRIFKEKYWKKMKLVSFTTSLGPVVGFSKDNHEMYLEQIWTYVQKNKEKIIWSNSRNF